MKKVITLFCVLVLCGYDYKIMHEYKTVSQKTALFF